MKNYQIQHGLGGWAALFIMVLTFACSVVVLAQYSIPRDSFSTIGGKSTGGTFSLRSGVGTTAPGAATGAGFSVKSSPWSLFVVDTVGAPALRIFLSNSVTAVVVWPSPSTGWLLQQNTNSISSANWSNVTAAIQDDGTTKTFLVSPPKGSRFYRLFKP